MNKPTLYITLGYPGSGKSYFAERFVKDRHIFHLPADALRQVMFDNPKYTPDEHRLVFRTRDFIAEQLLSQCVSVIYDANLNKLAHRTQKQQIAARCGANYQLLWVRTREELALKRLAKRAEGRSGELAVTLEVFSKLRAEFEALTRDEPFVEISGQLPYEEQIKRLTRHGPG